ncbi:TniQ family protein [Acetobacter oryzifermentans]
MGKEGTPSSLPLVPFPHRAEAFSSWLSRLAARYDLHADHLALHAGYPLRGARELDCYLLPQADCALALMTGLSQRSIRTMRCGMPQRRLWVRDHHVWCRECVREALLEGDEPWERRSWRTGATVICSRHRRVLEEACPRCNKIGKGCLFLSDKGRVQPLCAVKGDKINLWGDALGDQLPWGLTIDRTISRCVNALSIDLCRSLVGQTLRAQWRGVSRERRLTTIIEELTLITLITIDYLPRPQPPLYWMLEQSDWKAAFHYTPAMLPTSLATGIIMLVSVVLSDHQFFEDRVFWDPSECQVACEPLTPETYVMWLHPKVRSWGRQIISAPFGV